MSVALARTFHAVNSITATQLRCAAEEVMSATLISFADTTGRSWEDQAGTLLAVLTQIGETGVHTDAASCN